MFLCTIYLKSHSRFIITFFFKKLRSNFKDLKTILTQQLSLKKYPQLHKCDTSKNKYTEDRLNWIVAKTFWAWRDMSFWVFRDAACYCEPADENSRQVFAAFHRRSCALYQVYGSFLSRCCHHALQTNLLWSRRIFKWWGWFIYRRAISEATVWNA